MEPISLRRPSFLKKASLVPGLALFFLLKVSPAAAAYFTLPVLTQSQTDPIFRNLAGAFVFRDVEGANDLGKNWGFTLGVRGSLVDATPFTAVASSFTLPYLPSGDAQIAVGLPRGFTFEFGMVPTLSYQGTTFSQYSAGVKWTLTRSLLPKVPVSLAIRAGYTNANVSYSQQISGVDTDITYSTSIATFQAIASKRFFIFEPYVALGLANHTSSLSSTGSITIFGTDFSAGTTNYSAGSLCFWPSAGLLIHLGFIGAAAEYSNLWGLTAFSGKFTIRI